MALARAGRKLIDAWTRFWDRLADLYWRDPVRRARHQLEVDVMRYGGKVTWND